MERRERGCAGRHMETEEYDVDFVFAQGGGVGFGGSAIDCEEEVEATCDAVYLGIVPSEV